MKLRRTKEEMSKMKILVEAPAYERLLVHMLQYGSKELKNSEPVLGLIYGIKAGDTITIKESIPVKHGEVCNRELTETDKVNFTEIDKQYEEQGLQPFGFYLSHPKMGYYLSQTEMKNLVYFHKEKGQENAFAIIGDHAQMENDGDLGIQAMKLENPDKGTHSDFTKIDTVVQDPQDLSLFRKTKQLIEQGQKHKPYIEEQGAQLQADDDIWGAFDDEDDLNQKAQEDLAPIIESLANDVENVKDTFLKSLLYEIHSFTEDTLNEVKQPFDNPTSDLLHLRESLEKGIENVQDWFDENMKIYSQKIMKEYQRTFKMVEKAHTKNLYVISELLKRI